MRKLGKTSDMLRLFLKLVYDDFRMILRGFPKFLSYDNFMI